MNDDNLVFCNFPQDGMIPIWNFYETQSRREELEQAYAGWATERDFEVFPAPRVCILDLMIVEGRNAANPYKVNNRDYYRLNYDLNAGCGEDTPYIYIYYLPGMENDSITPIAEVCTINTTNGEALDDLPAGFHLIEHDLNRGVGGDYIYLAYRRKSDHSDQLVSGLSVNSAYSLGTSEAFTWYAVTRGYDSANPQDLNEDAGGHYIYLYYTHDHVEEEALPLAL